MNNDVIKNCRICNSASVNPPKKYEKNHLVRSRQCSFVFSRLRPTEHELNSTYASYQRDSTVPTSITLEKLSNRAKWHCSKMNDRKVLDVGCGDGHLLAAFSQLGFKTYGTEFDKASANAAAAKCATMLEGGLFPSLPEDTSGFDVIIFTEIIEHINNPLLVLNHSCNIFNLDGLLFITTPYFNFLERYVLGPNWGMITYPEHISFYSPTTLDNVVNMHRLKKVNSHTENISIYRLIQFVNRFRNAKLINAENVSVQAQAVVAGNKLLKLFKLVVNTVLCATNLGSSLVATYQKK
jgi:2-polyprenyl-3-methyl-5-hydroxy-6-metoxy-1,4-benzoquinol methylase